jgi:hypothetical protein
MGLVGTTQLLVNYAAEKLLWLSRESMYQREEGLYLSEGISVPPVTWWDNEGVVKIVESKARPVGIVEIIDEACQYHLSDACVLLQQPFLVVGSLLHTRTGALGYPGGEGLQRVACM